MFVPTRLKTYIKWPPFYNVKVYFQRTKGDSFVGRCLQWVGRTHYICIEGMHTL